MSVFCTIAFPAFKSAAHAVWMLSVNHSMFAAHAVVSVFVWHVPHTIAFSAVRLFCACLWGEGGQMGVWRASRDSGCDTMRNGCIRQCETSWRPENVWADDAD